MSEPISISTDARLILQYRRLNHVRRCNNFPTLRNESVAEHSYQVTLMAVAIATEYASNSNNELGIDPQYVGILALCHDLEESFTSDIPWNVKHLDEDTHSAIGSAISSIEDGYYIGSNILGSTYRQLCDSSKDGPNGAVVDIADMLELSLYLYDEVTSGNRYMCPLLDRSVRLVSGMEHFDELRGYSTILSDLFYMVAGASDAYKDGFSDGLYK